MKAESLVTISLGPMRAMGPGGGCKPMSWSFSTGGDGVVTVFLCDFVEVFVHSPTCLTKGNP